MLFFYVTLAVVLLLLFASLVVTWLLCSVSTKRSHVFSWGDKDHPEPIRTYQRRIEQATWLSETPSERVSVVSRDGLRLSARYYPRENAKRSFLLVHGYRSSGDHDFAESAEWIYRNLEASLLVIDQRSHGESEGKYICFGVKERYDLLLWHSFLRKKEAGLPLYWMGISMGSATVLMGLSADGTPKGLSGVIADCGYTSAKEEFRYLLKKDYHLPSFPVLFFADLYCRAFEKWSFSGASTIDAVKANERVPILFVHGDADTFVPYDFSVQNDRACKAPHTFFTAKKAVHGLSWYYENDEYIRRLNEHVRLCEEKNA